jgi:hypothetical protein
VAVNNVPVISPLSDVKFRFNLYQTVPASDEVKCYVFFEYSALITVTMLAVVDKKKESIINYRKPKEVLRFVAFKRKR